MELKLKKKMPLQRKKTINYCLHLNIFLLLILISGAASQSAVEKLPGYPGILPFKLETGYISVGEDEEIKLFYYFFESENDARTDPLILWLTGGPGCSAFSGLVYEIGPLNFDVEHFDGSFPNFTINPYSWTKVASIIFLDSPVGTGFSYSTREESYTSTDTTSAKYDYMFLKKWLLLHPTFLKNRLYIAGDSHGGKIVPIVALHIAQGNEYGNEPRMQLKGYIIGNSRTDVNKDDNELIPYMHRTALISDEYFALAQSSCHGEYVNPDPKNVRCTYALHLVNECMKDVNTGHILEPKCKFISPRPNDIQWGRSLLEDPADLLALHKQEQPWCRNYNYVTSYIWANDETVQDALHIRKGTKTTWARCNKTLTYEEDVESVLEHHQILSEKGYQVLAYRYDTNLLGWLKKETETEIYCGGGNITHHISKFNTYFINISVLLFRSGDHDMVIPYMSTLKWIRELNLTLSDPWRAWTVDGQVGGYTETYQNNQAFLVFATVKGAGHTALEYKPKECFAMIKRWLSLYPF